MRIPVYMKTCFRHQSHQLTFSPPRGFAIDPVINILTFLEPTLPLEVSFDTRWWLSKFFPCSTASPSPVASCQACVSKDFTILCVGRWAEVSLRKSLKIRSGQPNGRTPRTTSTAKTSPTMASFTAKRDCECFQRSLCHALKARYCLLTCSSNHQGLPHRRSRCKGFNRVLRREYQGWWRCLRHLLFMGESLPKGLERWQRCWFGHERIWVVTKSSIVIICRERLERRPYFPFRGCFFRQGNMCGECWLFE